VRGIVISNYKIENMVASAHLEKELDLHRLAIDIEGANYDPESFPGLIVRMKEPKTATLIFHSGKIVCTGAKNLEQIKKSLEAVKKSVEKAGVPISSKMDFVVQNIVASANLEQPINLIAISITLGLDKVEYEPEQFPGLVYHMSDPKVTMLLFTSGKLVCTGGRTGQDVEIAVEKLKEILVTADLLKATSSKSGGK
jgi:transcription initiation factor TFIID TATA-box-binding protein